MEPAEIIRQAVAAVGHLRIHTTASPSLAKAVKQIKTYQARRFLVTYSDLLKSSEYGPAAQFFLDELYSCKDFELRDAQFARIAGALQILFPKQVINTAVSLAQLHRLTEELDQQMGMSILSDPKADEHTAYVNAWNVVGRKDDRDLQLKTVLTVGAELERLTRTPGLRLMLKMMRRPAHAAGLGALQEFLESGFDTFFAMSGKQSLAANFLSTIEKRESKYMKELFCS